MFFSELECVLAMKRQYQGIVLLFTLAISANSIGAQSNHCLSSQPDKQNINYSQDSLKHFSDKLALTAMPGSGSATAYVGVLSASLTIKTARLFIHKHPSKRTLMHSHLQKLNRLRSKLFKLANQDTNNFNKVKHAWHNPNKLSVKCHKKVFLKTVNVPINIMRINITILKQQQFIAELINDKYFADLLVAAHMSFLSIQSASRIIKSNSSLVSNIPVHDKVINKTAHLRKKAIQLLGNIEHDHYQS